MSIFKNVFKQAPHFISNLFAGAVAALTIALTFGTEVKDAFVQANCEKCVNVVTKVIAVSTAGLGVAKVFTKIGVQPIPVEPASEPIPVEPAPEPVPVEPAPESIPVEPEPVPKPKERTRKSK